MASQFKAFGVWWPKTVDPVSMHLDCIKAGGSWLNKYSGEQAGGGMEFHYKQVIHLLWPEVVFHKWFDLILEKYLKHRTIAILGPASSGKTFTAALLVLVDYFAHPSDTTVICCSTTKERLEDRVWGCIKEHFKSAKAQRKWLPGNIIEGRLRIVTDSRTDSPDGRDFRNGCIGVPCKRGETFIGISEFAGIKNKRVRLLGDELSMLPKAFVDSISNLDKNPDFKCIGLGNPKDTTDALGVLAEPSVELGGWESGIDQSFGTKTWPTRREGGIAIQLPGDDSPNLDGKLGIPIISQADINRDVSFYGQDSIWYTMMDLGRMPKGQGSRRVLTRQLCMKFHATDEPVWRDTNLKRVAFLDAAYRGVGGDRCVFGELVWGYEAVMQKTFVAESSIANSVAFNPQNHQIIALVDTTVVPINPALDVLPEDQIVKFVMDQCTARGIPPQNFFFDSGMRTSLVSAFSRVWDVGVQSVDCGGTAGEEPVSHNITKSCKDYYFNFISQLWFSVRLAVESGQFRGMTDDVMMEFCEREWMIVGANKIQVEPKRKMKEKCFIAGTLITTTNGDVPIELIQEGDMIETPFGASEVIRTHEHESGDLTSVKFSNGRTLTGTSDHKVFTWNRGWTCMDELNLHSKVEYVSSLWLWKFANAFFTRTTSTTFKHLVDITAEAGTGSIQNRRELYTGLSGRIILDRFLKANAFITLMGIGKTIASTIWSWLILENTPDTICANGGRIQNSEPESWLEYQSSLKNRGFGIVQRKAGSGIEKMENSTGLNASNRFTPVSSVENHSRRFTVGRKSALKNARISTTCQSIKMFLRHVCSAVNNLWEAGTIAQSIVPKSVQALTCGESVKVYNLTLLEHNAYYANGILVANCGRSPDLADAVAVGIFGARQRGFQIARLEPDKPLRRGRDWRDELRDKSKKIWQTGQLEHASG